MACLSLKRYLPSDNFGFADTLNGVEPLSICRIECQEAIANPQAQDSEQMSRLEGWKVKSLTFQLRAIYSRNMPSQCYSLCFTSLTKNAANIARSNPAITNINALRYIVRLYIGVPSGVAEPFRKKSNNLPRRG